MHSLLQPEMEFWTSKLMLFSFGWVCILAQPTTRWRILTFVPLSGHTTCTNGQRIPDSGVNDCSLWAESTHLYLQKQDYNCTSLGLFALGGTHTFHQYEILATELLVLTIFQGKFFYDTSYEVSAAKIRFGFKCRNLGFVPLHGVQSSLPPGTVSQPKKLRFCLFGQGVLTCIKSYVEMAAEA